MGVLQLRDVDFSELYMYLELYERTYNSNLSESLKIRTHLEQCYCVKHGLKDTSGVSEIFHKISRNPREAGRKKSYTEEGEKAVWEYIENGMSIREVSRKTGMSAGTVQRIKKETEGERCIEIKFVHADLNTNKNG